MTTLFKHFSRLLVLLAIVSIFGVAVAAQQGDNVTVTVKDSTGRKLPFASVTVNKIKDTTGPQGQAAGFDLGNGEYKVKASHTLVENKNDVDLVGQASFTIDKKRPRANITITLKGKMELDTTPPVISEVNPKSQSTGNNFRVANNRAIELVVRAEDPQSGVAQAAATLDGKTISTLKPSNTNTYRWSIPAMTVGTHTVKYLFWNYAGQKAEHTLLFTVNEPTGTITGTVTYAGQPVAGAQVSLAGYPTVTTAADGTFAMTDITIGQQTLSITADGLDQKQEAVTVIQDQSVTAAVALTDSITPAVPTNTKASAGQPSATSQVVSWTAVTDRSGVRYEVERFAGSQSAEIKQVTEATATFDNLQPDTQYSYRVRAIDLATPANTSAWTSSLRATTQQLPSASWASPHANQKISGTVNLTVNTTAFGDGNTIKQVTFAVKPNTTIKTLDVTAGQPVSATWDTTGLNNGTYALVVTVTDAEGNTGRNELPIVIENSLSLTGQVTVAGQAVANATVTSDDNKTATTDQNGNYRLAGLTPGTHTLTASAPELGNQTKTVTVTAGNNPAVNFELSDTTAPTAPTLSTLTNAKPTASTQSLSWTAATDRTGIKTYEIEHLIDGTVIDKAGVTVTTAQFTNLSANTNHTYRVRAQDNAGNWSTWSATKSLTTQKLPSVNWTSPSANQSVRGEVPVSAQLTAFGGTIKEAKLNLMPDTTLTTATPNAATATLNYSWNTAALEGTKTLRLSVTDTEDNVTVSDVTVVIATNPGTAAGRVTDSQTNATLSGMTVELKQGATMIATTQTVADGRYQFDNVQPGTYQMVLGDEGYTSKTIDNIQVTSNQTATTDVAMVSLPRATFTGTVRELVAPDSDGWFNPLGASVRANTDELIITQQNGRAHFYNAQTEQVVSRLEASIVGGIDMIAHDKDGLLLAYYGNSVWANILGKYQNNGDQLGYRDIASTVDSMSVYAITPDRLYKYTNRVRSNGMDISPIAGSAQHITLGKKTVFTSSSQGTTNLITKLDMSNPTNAGIAKVMTVSYIPGEIHYISGSNTLLVQEAKTNRIHVLDAQSLAEYGTMTLPADNIPGQINIASFKSGNVIKAFITTASQNKVLVAELAFQ